MTGEAGDALSFIPGLAQARPHSHSEDKLVVTAFDSGMERITAAGAYLKREVLAVWPTSDKCFGYKNQIIRAHRGAGDSALARRHASYSNPIVGRLERRTRSQSGMPNKVGSCSHTGSGIRKAPGPRKTWAICAQAHKTGSSIPPLEK